MNITSTPFPSTLLDNSRCPICGDDAQTSAIGSLYAFRCRLCGDFFVSRTDAETRTPIEIELQPFVGAATRQATESGKHVVLDREYRSLAEPHRGTSFNDRMGKLLAYIGSKCRRPGRDVQIFSPYDYTLADAEDPNEFAAYVVALSSMELIKSEWIGTGPSPHFKCYPTFQGWDALAPPKIVGGIPCRCFVAQSFKEEMRTAYYAAIKPAIEEAGYVSRSLLDFVPNDGITDRILAEVRQAEFIIADFTDNRPGVYFEAGFARGLGRPEIGSCRRDHFNAAHFDIKHFGHVLWDTHEELRIGLVASIRANIIRPT